MLVGFRRRGEGRDTYAETYGAHAVCRGALVVDGAVVDAHAAGGPGRVPRESVEAVRIGDRGRRRARHVVVLVGIRLGIRIGVIGVGVVRVDDDRATLAFIAHSDARSIATCSLLVRVDDALFCHDALGLDGRGGEEPVGARARETLSLQPLDVAGADARVGVVVRRQACAGELQPPFGRQLCAVETVVGADFRGGVLVVVLVGVLGGEEGTYEGHGQAPGRTLVEHVGVRGEDVQ